MKAQKRLLINYKMHFQVPVMHQLAIMINGSNLARQGNLKMHW